MSFYKGNIVIEIGLHEVKFDPRSELGVIALHIYISK